jgi:thiosulfate dehydrogenase [quinone] large subunit
MDLIKRDKNLAYFLLRICLGMNIFLHGAVRVLTSYQKFVQTTTLQFIGSPLPDFSVTSMAYFIPPAEMLIGLLMMLGLFTRSAFIAGILLMLILMFGMSILQHWDIVGLQMTYVALYAALLFLREYNVISLDQKYRLKSKL